MILNNVQAKDVSREVKDILHSMKSQPFAVLEIQKIKSVKECIRFNAFIQKEERILTHTSVLN